MMRDSQDTPSFEATVRRAFAQLTAEDLPRAAIARGWILRSPAEFESLLLDHLAGASGRGDSRDCCLVDLILAVELGGRLIAGTLCCHKMLDRLGVPCGQPPDPTAAANAPTRQHH